MTACTKRQKKKRHVILQKYSASAEERKKKRGNMRERGRCVSTSADNKRCTGARTKNRNSKNYLLVDGIATSITISSSPLAKYITQYDKCITELGLLLHLYSWHQKNKKVQATSCLKLGAGYDTPPKLSTSTWFISNEQLLNCTTVMN